MPLPRWRCVVSAIDAVARALCNEDQQRHRLLEKRNGTPCRTHVMAAWTAVGAVVELLRREVGAPEDAGGAYSEAAGALRMVYGVLSQAPDEGAPCKACTGGP